MTDNRIPPRPVGGEGDEPPRFWKTWRRLYAVQLIYWALLMAFMILATWVLNR